MKPHIYLVPKPEPIRERSTHRQRLASRLWFLAYFLICLIGGSLVMVYVERFGS